MEFTREKKWFNCRRDTGALLRVMSLIFSSTRSKRWSRYVGTKPDSNSHRLTKEKLHDGSGRSKQNIVVQKTKMCVVVQHDCTAENTRKIWSGFRKHCAWPSIQRLLSSSYLKLLFPLECGKRAFIRAHYSLMQSYRGYFPKPHGNGFHGKTTSDHSVSTPANRIPIC